MPVCIIGKTMVKQESDIFRSFILKLSSNELPFPAKPNYS